MSQVFDFQPNTKCMNCGIAIYKRPNILLRQKLVTCSIECSLDYKRKNSKGWCFCENCKKNFRTNPAYLKRTPTQKRFCSYDCVREYKHNHPNKLRISNAGYLEGSIGGRAFRLHRKIMEEHLGRKLEPNEHVNHINGDKLDNRIENLEVISHSQHMRLHGLQSHLKHSVPTKCRDCGKPRRLLLSYIKSKYNGDVSKIKKYRCKDCHYRSQKGVGVGRTT